MWKATQAAAVTRAKQVSRSPQRSSFVFCLPSALSLLSAVSSVLCVCVSSRSLVDGRRRWRRRRRSGGGVGWSWGRTRASTPTVHIKDIEKSFSFSVELCSATAQSLRCSFQPSFYDYKYLCLSRFSILGSLFSASSVASIQIHDDEIKISFLQTEARRVPSPSPVPLPIPGSAPDPIVPYLRPNNSN